MKVLFEPIEKFKGHCHVERWGTVANAVLHITGDVEAGLRYGWDCLKYNHGKKNRIVDGDNNDVGGVKLKDLDETIKSPFWWAYWRMLDRIAQALFDILRWCESCSCHFDLLEELRAGDRGHDEEVVKRVRDRASKCPLRGMRCHDVCAGGLLDYVKQRLSYHVAEFASHLPNDIGQPDKQSILEQCESGRAHIVAYYTVKLAH
eukprot:5209980-Pyramimonas_sp.AAC.1